ncbi:MAG: hypothetical protein K2O15_05255 [Lachnospiraceae bacterium]|nr:hypothetical protein [Lachnospiraceae bacterium]
MREKLEPYIEESTYGQIISHYHFRKSDEAQIRDLADRLLSMSEPLLYYAPYSLKEQSRLAVLVTLGAGADELQRVCTEEGRLGESYMIECIAMELLGNAYEQSAEKIHEHYGLWTGPFAFLGSAAPIEEMEALFHILEPQEISYNQAYMLTPKKTVAFETTLTQRRQESYCNQCETCRNTKCIHRKAHLTYGYQQIFGKREFMTGPFS